MPRPPLDPAALVAETGTWSVTQPGGATVATIDVKGASATLSFPGGKLVAAPRGGARRYTQDGQLMAKVKRRGLRVRIMSKTNTLLWKAELEAERIRIADAEQGEAMFVIAREPSGAWLVEQGESRLGRVDFDGKTRRLRVLGEDGQARYVAPADRAQESYGVLLLAAIPEWQRYVLMTELLARGR